MAIQIKDSALLAECHECENLTKSLWSTERGEIRACSQKCADDYESGAGAEQ